MKKFSSIEITALFYSHISSIRCFPTFYDTTGSSSLGEHKDFDLGMFEALIIIMVLV